MRIQLSAAALLLAASGCFTSAAAQAIYRCGNSFSQQPCPGSTEVRAEDGRSAGQRAEASAAARRDAKAADALEKARLKEEAKPVQAYIPPPKPQDDGKADGKRGETAKAKQPAVFKATAPAKPGEAKANKKKAKKNAARRGASSGA